MIDQQLETQIKKTQEFIELWDKFHEIYKDATTSEPFSEKREKDFLETKGLVNNRFDDLMDNLGVKPLNRFFKGNFIYEILALNALSSMSHDKLQDIDKNWKTSYGFLNSTLDRLGRKKRRISDFNKSVLSFKKILKGKKIEGGKK